MRQQDAYPATAGGGAVTTMCNTPASFSRATSPSLIVCLYLADSTLLQLTPACVQWRWCINNRDRRRVSGVPLLEVMCHRHSDGPIQVIVPHPIASTVHALYTNAAPCHASVDVVYNSAEKYSKMQHILLIVPRPIGSTVHNSTTRPSISKKCCIFE